MEEEVQEAPRQISEEVLAYLQAKRISVLVSEETLTASPHQEHQHRFRTGARAALLEVLLCLVPRVLAGCHQLQCRSQLVLAVT